MKYILYITIAICFFITAAGCTPDAQQPQKNAVSRRATKKKARTKKVTAPVSDAVKNWINGSLENGEEGELPLHK